MLISCRFRSTFSRVYGPEAIASGSTFAEAREKMLLLGYDPAKHAVLSYHAGQDMQIVWKILAGIDQMLFPRLHIDKCMTAIPGTSLQPVSIRGLVCNMMDIPPGKHQS